MYIPSSHLLSAEQHYARGIMRGLCAGIMRELCAGLCAGLLVFAIRGLCAVLGHGSLQ